VLNLRVSVDGDKIVIHNLQGFTADLREAVHETLAEDIAPGIFNEAFLLLSGAGGLNVYEDRISKKGNAYRKKVGSNVEEYTGFTRQSGEDVTFKKYAGAGAYPVPIRVGWLRRQLNWLKPGQSKDGFFAGDLEIIEYDAAQYARVVHEGYGSSAKFGPRRYLTDALERFNKGARIAGAVEEKIQQKLDKRG